MLFAGRTQAHAGQKIGEVVKDFDTSLPAPARQMLISQLLQKHFGTVDNPNPKLIPNVPAQEKDRIMGILKKEIMAQGQDAVDPNEVSLAKIQGYKIGAGDKAHYDKSITSGEEKLWRNINGAYNGVTTDAAPELAKWNKQFGDATKALQQHGGGITGLANHFLNGGGALGWWARGQLLAPVVHGIMNTITSNNAQQVNADQPQHIGFGQQ